MSDPSGEPSKVLTHVDLAGHARMVDVGDKQVSAREAVAASRITMSSEAAQALRSNALAKGDAMAVARIAAIAAVKQTSSLIPLCHAISIDGVKVDGTWLDATTLEWQVTVRSTGKTGVEMEALTAASVAALAVYDMCKAIDRSMEIGRVRLLEKSGGQRGNYRRTE